MLNAVIVLLISSVCIANAFNFSENCGKSKAAGQEPDWRIVGGVDAAVGEFPWQVILTPVQESVIDDNNNFCGGTIISDKYILTAGHCVEGRLAAGIKIRLGVHNFRAKEASEVDVLVKSIHPHEGFVHALSYVLNDVALIRLNETLDFKGKHSHLEPICLAKPDTKLTNKCVASGFGFVNTKRQRPADGILQKVADPVAEASKCKAIFAHFDSSQQVCAGGLHEGGKAVCNGDSGGPLQCQADDGRFHQIGVVSYGFPCALPDKPDVFTSVAYFHDWISRTIDNNP